MEDNGRPLHIVLTSYRGNMFCGGQGVYLVNLARALAALGHRVRVMAGPPFPEAAAGAETELFPDENFINRSARHLPENPLEVFHPLTFLEYGLARLGSNPEMLAAGLRFFKRIRELHRALPVDVVHDNQGLGYGVLLVRALGIPVVATIHHPLQVDRGEDILQTRGLLGKARRAVYYPILMQRLVARRLDRVICVSGFSRELVSEAYGLDRGRVAVAPNGVDGAVFRPAADARREPGRLLFVGSTEDRKKGIIYLLEALASLPERFRLVIVDGRRYPGRVYAKNAVESMGLGPRVEFKDKITTPELVREYNRARMMVMPSLFEGFGLPALEAMACGAPLVVTTAGALPEVADADCAVFIRPRSAAEIREAVLALDQDEERLARMSAAGRARAGECFSWEAAAERVLASYRLAIRKPGAQNGRPAAAGEAG